MGVTTLMIEIANPAKPEVRARLEFMVDSGSIYSVVPAAVNVLGGQQSARTLHFFLTWALVLFLLVHVFMVFLAGFRSRMRAMITGRGAEPLERV